MSATAAGLVGLLGVVVGSVTTIVVQGRALRQERREALRNVYGQLLVSQRESREASRQVARATGEKWRPQLEAAVQAHSKFIDAYHKLNLDTDRHMWLEARALRNVLDDMLQAAESRNAELCEHLMPVARHARQNLERALRTTYRRSAVPRVRLSTRKWPRVERFEAELQRRTRLPPQFDKVELESGSRRRRALIGAVAHFNDPDPRQKHFDLYDAAVVLRVADRRAVGLAALQKCHARFSDAYIFLERLSESEDASWVKRCASSLRCVPRAGRGRESRFDAAVLLWSNSAGGSGSCVPIDVAFLFDARDKITAVEVTERTAGPDLWTQLGCV